MAKVKVKRNKQKGGNGAVDTKNEGAPDADEGGPVFLVTLKDGRAKPLAAVLQADSAGDAKDFFVTLCGIIGTEHPITAEPLDEERAADLATDENGIVQYPAL